MVLTTTSHERDAQGLTYVYAVVSRRSKGVSVGVNLNPNDACNWRCIYCQVPNLSRGGAPEIDLERLSRELDGMLRDIVEGDFLDREAPPEARRLNDVAISGNGEPTSSTVFDQVVARIGEALDAHGLRGKVAPVLITNGSLVHRPVVQRGLETLAALGGEVWFKLDASGVERRGLINGVRVSDAQVERNLGIAAGLCPTKVQTCVFALDGDGPSATQRGAYVAVLKRALERGAPLRGVLLYGLARPSAQIEAPRLARLDAQVLEAFADEIRELGLGVSVHA